MVSLYSFFRERERVIYKEATSALEKHAHTYTRDSRVKQFRDTDRDDVKTHNKSRERERETKESF